MDENKSDIKEKNKDEIWYGWIPKLSHEMTVRVKTENGYENKFFDEVEQKDLEKVFKSEYILMSDKRVDRLFNRRHHVEFSNHDISVCECCGEKVWSVTVDIKGKNDKSLIKGTANIHKSGLVRYEILYNKIKGKKGEEPINKAQDIHKIVRDHLHFHLYHSSDMPLPPVKVDEKCDEDLAKEKILKRFLDAFIVYKREVGRVNLANEEKDLSRALGEIIYANSALDKFSERKYLFSWDDIIMGNTAEFIKFLKDELKIEGVEDTDIKKSDNNETITVTHGKNLITFKLNKKEKKINLEVSGGKRYEYILKEENDKLNIYKEKNYEEFKKSFENFDRAFKVLLQKTINRRNRISQFIVLLSSIIAVFALIKYVRLFSFPYSDEVIILSLLLLIFIVLHLLIKIYGLRRAQK